jgi:hypothetical protein
MSKGMPRLTDRRTAPRPRDGDIQSCPYCRAGSLQFRERPPAADNAPAWFCDNPSCGYRTFARSTAGQSMDERHRAVKERSARAHRQSMAIRARVERLKEESARLRTTRPSRKK